MSGQLLPTLESAAGEASSRVEAGGCPGPVSRLNASLHASAATEPRNHRGGGEADKASGAGKPPPVVHLGDELRQRHVILPGSRGTLLGWLALALLAPGLVELVDRRGFGGLSLGSAAQTGCGSPRLRAVPCLSPPFPGLATPPARRPPEIGRDRHRPPSRSHRRPTPRPVQPPADHVNYTARPAR